MPSLPFDVSVSSLPLPQSFGSGENGFLDFQRNMPNSSGLLARTPKAMIDLPSGAQWIERPTLNFGSSMQRGVRPSLVSWPRHRFVSSPSLRAIAITFTSAVGAQAGSENSSPSPVSGSAGASGFSMSLRNTRPAPM